jgi:hypothetical protein
VPTIIGKYIDFGDITMGPGAFLRFVPTGNAVDSRNSFSKRPVRAIPGDNGNWSVELRSSYGLRPMTGYRPQFAWPIPGDLGGGYTTVDYPEWILYVPPEGGNFGDLVDTGDDTVNPLMVVTSPQQPPFIALNMFWLDTANGGSKLKRAELV